jgi:Xaa-Pro aminopeptidase
MFVPDPFVYFRNRGRSAVVMSDLEIDRARKQARVDEVISLTGISRPLEERLGRRPKLVEVIATIFRQRRIASVRVPANFPLGMAAQLRKRGIRIRAEDKPFFPRRECKRPDEVRHIERALRITAAGIAAGIATIRASRIARDGRLMLGGRTLTSGRVRAEINCAIIRLGGMPAHTIVAGGDQACDPHERGSGPLRAHQAIILDVFPRDERSGYYGDMTRTVVRGRAGDALRRQFEAVRDAQRLAINKIRAGVNGRAVHRAVQKLFEERRFKTEVVEGQQQGFFHGTGHGLGLEVHEPPRISVVPCRLKAGHVVTVEPGLYYPGIGGVRIEDVVLVTRSGCRVLSTSPVVFELTA